MAEERNVGLARAPETEDADAASDATKEELQRRMDEARESISQTVSEIKETVVTQYQNVRESISDSLDWREQYRRRPVEFSVGALGVGLVLGYTIGGAIVGGRASEDDYEEDDYNTAEEDYGGLLDDATPREVRAAPSRPVSKPAQMFAAQAAPASSASRGSAPQSLASYGAAESAQVESEPTGPGIVERFKGTRAYDRLQQELSTLGDRAVDELSKTAQVVVLPAILGKLKDLIGLDLSTQREVAQRSQLEQQSAKASAATASAADASGSTGTTPRV